MQSVLSQRKIKLIQLCVDPRSVVIVVAKDMINPIVGNWLVSRTGGKSAQISKKTEVLKVTEYVVPRVLIEERGMDQRHTTLMQLPLMNQIFQYSQKSN